MKKVFYSVRYTELALCKKSCTMWFDNLKEAKEFSKADYRDKPVKHVYSSKATIEMVEDLINLQKN